MPPPAFDSVEMPTSTEMLSPLEASSVAWKQGLTAVARMIESRSLSSRGVSTASSRIAGSFAPASPSAFNCFS